MATDIKFSRHHKISIKNGSFEIPFVQMMMGNASPAAKKVAAFKASETFYLAAHKDLPVLIGFTKSAFNHQFSDCVGNTTTHHSPIIKATAKLKDQLAIGKRQTQLSAYGQIEHFLITNRDFELIEMLGDMPREPIFFGLTHIEVFMCLPKIIIAL